MSGYLNNFPKKLNKIIILQFVVVLCNIFPTVSNAANDTIAANPTFAQNATIRGKTEGKIEERILLYKSDIQVRTDGSLLVTETIQVQGNNNKIVHGIYRDFPTIYKNSGESTTTVPFRVMKVTRDHNTENYHLSRLQNGVRVYMGDRHTRLIPGIYSYTITYYTNKQLGFFKDYDELYWNVTGNDWKFPIEKVIAEVNLPEGTKILNTAAYTGLAGEQGKDFNSYINDKGNVVFETTKPLTPKEGFTIAVSWPKGIVIPTQQFFSSIYPADRWSAILALIGLCVVTSYYFFMRRIINKSIKQSTIIPLFEPPAGLSPAKVNFIYFAADLLTLRKKGLSASIVDMAVKGFLKIKKEGKSFILEKIDQNSKTVFDQHSKEMFDQGSKTLFEDEKILADGFFSSKSIFKLSDLSGNKTRLSHMKAVLNRFEKNLRKTSKEYFKSNYFFSFLGVALAVIILLVIIFFNHFENMTIYMIFLGTIFGTFLGGKFKNIFFIIGFFALLAALFSDKSNHLDNVFEMDFNNLMVLLLGASIIAMATLFFSLRKSLSDAGQALRNQIEGFKLFLSVTEENRYKMLQSPKVTTEVFEKYLPYAIALDVEKQWNKAISPEFMPIWYEQDQIRDQGSGISNFGRNLAAFTSVVSTSTLDAMAYNSFTSSSGSSPGSSSGSGGGGSSGGGGGGGGGGGW